MINPSLSIPSSVLPALPEGTREEARKNLLLETKDGKIEADVTFLPCSLPESGDEKGRRGKRVVLYAKTSDGRVVFILACYCSVLFLRKKFLTLCITYSMTPPPIQPTPTYKSNNHNHRRTHPPPPPPFLPRAMAPQTQGQESEVFRRVEGTDYDVLGG